MGTEIPHSMLMQGHLWGCDVTGIRVPSQSDKDTGTLMVAVFKKRARSQEQKSVFTAGSLDVNRF